MDIFDTTLVNPLLEREGGEKFTDHPSDRGGPTKWGVTAAKLGEYRKLGRAATAAEVRALERPEAVQIYRQEFFVNPGIDKVAAVSPRIAEEFFDTAVNMGPGRPSKWLQRSLNLCNRRGTDYPDISVDGDVGPGTIRALQSLVQRRGQRAAEDLILKCMNGFQFNEYVRLAEGSADQEDFFVGWVAGRIGLA